ncbi:hypothetical protein HFP72_10300 [Nocardiopsis sp. ARC36]
MVADAARSVLRSATASAVPPPRHHSTTARGPVRRTARTVASTGVHGPSIRWGVPRSRSAAASASTGRQCISCGPQASTVGRTRAAAPASPSPRSRPRGGGTRRRAEDTHHESRCSTST